MKNYNTEVKTPTTENLCMAGELLKKGLLVGFPTETVYGLGADGLNEAAVKEIFKAKGRPADNPLILHITDIADLDRLVKYVSETSKQLIDEFWPGPLTIIFDKNDIVPDIVTCSLPTVAVRMPANKVAVDIIRNAGCPIAAPSANTSGKPSPTRAEDVYNDLNGSIPLIIDGGSCKHGLESTVIDARDNDIKILRPGAVTYEMLQKYSDNVMLAKGMLTDVKLKNPSSPGMKYKHYSPKANVVILKGSKTAVRDYFESSKDENSYILVAKESIDLYNVSDLCIEFGSISDKKTFGANLYAIFRDLDKRKAETIYIEYQGEDGILLAVYNRMLRAAGFNVIQL